MTKPSANGICPICDSDLFNYWEAWSEEDYPKCEQFSRKCSCCGFEEHVTNGCSVFCVNGVYHEIPSHPGEGRTWADEWERVMQIITDYRREYQSRLRY